MNKKIGYLYISGTAFLWGTSFIAGKFAFNGVDTIMVVIIRFLIASFFWIPIFIKSFYLVKKFFYQLIMISFLTYPATFLLEFIGLSYTSASSAVIILGLQPLVINIIGFLIWKDKITKHEISASILALLGVTIIIGMPSYINYFGCFLEFLATIVVAFWTRISKNMMTKIPPNNYTALTMIMGTILLFPFSLMVNDWNIQFTISNSLSLIYLGIGCTLIASWLYNKGLDLVESNKAGLFLALNPFFGVLLGVIILNEPITIWTIIGGILIILPMIIISFAGIVKLV